MSEVARLRAQRDYYRRRWLIHGIRFPSWLFRCEAYVAAAMERLERAAREDG